MTTYIKGNYRRSIYQNASGYNIGLFKVLDTNDEKLEQYLDRTITFTGYFHELNDMDTYIFYGKLVEHEKYGEQFQVESYERCKPEEKDSIIEFLTSGLFKGIGEKTAKKIADVLGKDTLKIILESPDNLLLIPTVTKKQVDILHNKLKEYESSYEIIIFLQDLGFTPKDSMLIYNYYKDRTKKIIEQDIYQIIYDITEITFKKIDLIASHMNIEKDALIRVKASIIYIMNEVSNTYGHSYYFKEELISYLPRVIGLQISEELFDAAVLELINDVRLVIADNKYYLKDMYDAETLIVKRLRILAENPPIKNERVSEIITDLEEFYKISYNTEQRLAIEKSNELDFLIITGGPGTGKTTIMQGITETYRALNKLSYEHLEEKVALLAPTGRAAKRMTEKTGLRASTIHRFLKWQKDTNKFQVNEYNKSKVEFVIIDESSMIDTYLMASLLRGLSVHCKIIMVGDDHQLPSVGPGQLLHDLIESDVLPVVKLKELYRQGKDSNIISLAYDVRNGEIIPEIFNKDEDLTFITTQTEKETIANIMEIATTYKDVSYKDFQILAPMYKSLIGIDEINKNLQTIFNPKDEVKKEIKIGETLFREQDKVIQLTNMPEENVYNGDIGIIEKITNSPKKEILIDFDGNLVKYTPSSFQSFRLAYAISIHKAQGSEFDIIIMPILKNYGKMLYRKLIYTGITRSKNKLYLIGNLQALNIAVQNISTDIRRTTIKDFLINGIK